jgi:hypothetical protein
MEVEWRPDDDGDWNLYVRGEYEGLLCRRFTGDETWRLTEIGRSHLTHTRDAEEAKSIAFALWALNK